MKSVSVRVVIGACLLSLAFTAVSAIVFRIKPVSDNTYCLTSNPNGNVQPLSFSKCSMGFLNQSMNAINPTSLIQVQTGISFLCGGGMCMTASVPGGDMAAVSTTKCIYTNLAQYWTQTSIPAGAQAGYSHLKNWVTGFCATAEVGGAYIDQYTCQPSIVGTEHQTWKIQFFDGTGLQLLTNGMAGNTNCLNLKDVNPLEGATFDAPLCSNTSYAGHFSFLGSFPWMIQVTGKCVDGGDGAPFLYQYDCTNSAPNQKWLQISYPHDQTPGSPIMNMGTGLCLTWDPTNLGNVLTTACTKGQLNQYFYGFF